MIDLFAPFFGDVSLFAIMALFMAAMVAGYIDTLVGGGGLITIPALLAAGVPPIAALGTNKLQATAGTATASLTLLSKKKLTLSQVGWPMLTAFMGAVFGAISVQYFDASVLEFLIPVVISIILVYFILAPKPKSVISAPRVSAWTYRATAVPAVGFYDGLLGPATGSFFVFIGMGLLGQNIVQASMLAKSLNFATNLAALMVFVVFGQVWFYVGLVMMVGQFVGASLGTKALMTINPSALRVVVVCMCLIMLGVWLIPRL